LRSKNGNELEVHSIAKIEPSKVSRDKERSRKWNTPAQQSCMRVISRRSCKVEDRSSSQRKVSHSLQLRVRAKT